MSEAYTRAWMDVRDTADPDLRERLHGALETLYEVTHLLNCEIGHVQSGVSGLQDELESARAETEEAEQKATVAEERLEEQLQTTSEIDATKLVERIEELEQRIEELEQEKAGLREKIEAQASLSEDIRFAVGDVLAMSRKLVSKCEAAGIKPAHVRPARKKA